MPSELIDNILIGNIEWLCDDCKLTNHSKSTNASLVSGDHGDGIDQNGLSRHSALADGAEELSWGAVYARLDKLEGKIKALWEENISLRTELAQCRTLRSDIKALEYRLDAMTFWGVTPGRPSDSAGPPGPLAAASLVTHGLGDLSGPHSTSSPIFKRANASSRVFYRDIVCGGPSSPALGRPLPSLPAPSCPGKVFSVPDGSVAVMTTASGASIPASIVPGSSGLGSGSSDSGLVPVPIATTSAPLASVPALETIVEVTDPIPGPVSIGDLRESSTPGDPGALPVGRTTAADNNAASDCGDRVGRSREETRRVRRAENKKRPLIVGSSASCPFSAVPARGVTVDGMIGPGSAQIFVTRLAPNVTADCIRDYLSSLGYTSSVVQLRPPRKVTSVMYNSFRIAISREFLGNLLSPDVWPPGAGVKEWFFRTPRAPKN